jgi:ribosomal protein S6--L-glutamate ligase
MRLCFIVEDRYRNDGMPLAVARQLGEWGHQVDLLAPQSSVARVSALVKEGAYDAWVLKTVSEGPGLSLLEAAAAWGVTTINDARAIRPVRDKAVAAAVAGRHGLPFPLTYFAAAPELLDKVPAEHYPLVVKPVNGSSGRSVYLVKNPRELAEVEGNVTGEGFMLAQPYVANPGVDFKVYNTGGELYATVQPSPLHPDIAVPPRTVPLSADLARLVVDVGRIFGLDLYGVDVVEGPEGWVVVDVNDFPSFRCVPDAVARVARTILRLADHGRGLSPALAGTEVGVAGDGSGIADRLAPAALISGPDDLTVAT